MEFSPGITSTPKRKAEHGETSKAPKQKKLLDSFITAKTPKRKAAHFETPKAPKKKKLLYQVHQSYSKEELVNGKRLTQF